jgi:AbrB family looped-hinge helix DNA binding protein
MNPSPNRRFYGSITVSDRGQIVIPAEARRDFNIEVGDKLLVLGDLEQGLAIIKASNLMDKMGDFMSALESSRVQPDEEEKAS